jgi:hypothetical protein
MIPERKIREAIERAEERTLKRGMSRALEFSSGKKSRKQLAKLGHPYAVRNMGKLEPGKPHRMNVPYGDPAKINVQSGTFYLSWVIEKPKTNGDAMNSAIKNIAPYASRLEKGIPGLTMPRPIMEKVIQSVEYWRERNIIAEIGKSLSY